MTQVMVIAELIHVWTAAFCPLLIDVLLLMGSPDQPKSKCVEFVVNDLSLSTDGVVE